MYLLSFLICEQIKMLDPVIISYGKGQLTGFIGDSKTIIDMVHSYFFTSSQISIDIWYIFYSNDAMDITKFII